jgi:hypothetical protein
LSSKFVLMNRLVLATTLVLFSLSSIAGACSNKAFSGFRAYLPDCRAYELVSPAYKEGFPVTVGGLSEDGSRLRIETSGSFSYPENTSPSEQSYLLARAESGWESTPLDAPFSTFPIYHVQGMSSDFGSSLWFASVPGRSVRDVYAETVGGRFSLMGPGAPPSAHEGELNFVGASDDLRHVLLLDHSPGGAEEGRIWPGDTTTSLGGRKPSLYEYEGTGNAEPRLVGVSNEEGIEEAARKEEKPHINEAAKLISNCGISLGSAEEEDAYNAVSVSGATVFFTAEACGSPPVNEVYARIEGRRTVAISEPSTAIYGRECTGACATAELEAGAFAGASRDGSKVFFSTSQPLVNGDGDSGVDLYEAEIPPGAVARLESGKTAITRLVQVSRGGVGDSTRGSGANVLGVARVSEDGSHVYFVAEGLLTGANGEGKSPVVDEPNMYVVVSECPDGEATCSNPVERTKFVATLSRGDKKDWRSSDRRPVQATPDGNFLVFQSVADLTGDEEGRAEAGQLFEYDAETETLVRVSRGENGYNEDGNTDVYPAFIPAQDREFSAPEERSKSLAISEDGSRVFFSSADALVPQALNGVCSYENAGVCVVYARNIYEYHGGRTSLISDGHDILSNEESPATMLVGTGESGRDVYFTTADRLVPEDGDTQIDIYDAREGGGFPAAEEAARCLGDPCQGSASVPPSLLTPLTTVVSGASGFAPSVTPVKPKAKTKAKPKSKKNKPKKSKGKRRKGKRAVGRRSR